MKPFRYYIVARYYTVESRYYITYRDIKAVIPLLY
jgi:hypothetical protein